MAVSVSHQIGAFVGTPLAAGTGGLSGEPARHSAPAKVNASAVWRDNLRFSFKKTADMDRLSHLPSPTPLGGGMRTDLSVACQALATEREAETEENLHGFQESLEKKEKGVPVFVMMPLDSVKMDNSVNRRKAMDASLQALKSAGVEGIMMDVWWGLVEREEPGKYNWGGYTELLEMAQKHGLKVQAVMSFHQCGGNVGDSCTWVF